MSGETNLEVLLASMSPRVRPGEFVFVSVADDAAAGIRAEATIREAEGVTLVITRGAADATGLAYDFVAGWITLEVHSALEAVGLTAAFSARLAAAGISCNVLAGYYHDHILVPLADLDRALAALTE